MKLKILLIGIVFSSFCGIVNSENVFSMDNKSVITENYRAENSKAYWVEPNIILFPKHKTENLCIGYFSKQNHYKKIPLKKSGYFKDDENLVYLNGYQKLEFYSEFDISEVLKGNPHLIFKDEMGKIEMTGIQNFGVLDKLFYYQRNDLGLTFNQSREPQFKLWSPVARNVKIHIFDDPESNVPYETFDMKENKYGVWEKDGKEDWENKYYLYEIELFVPSTGKIEHNFVTDPYSISLSVNSKKSHIFNINSTRFDPQKPILKSFNDIVIYELHVRDFSIKDNSVKPENKGKFLAFTENSNGMKHLSELAKSGLTHVHLLPIADMATINEDSKTAIIPEIPMNLPPDSPIPQEIIGKVRDKDQFNWGYDPLHYFVPEGSYAVNPDGSSRISEFRNLVESLNNSGLRVIMDVVYNHTHSAGQSENSIFDKIVPGYYYRLDKNGMIQNSTCCPDTASEHLMMEKLIIDSLVFWAKNYKIDGFRFDLMGHHTTDNLKNIRQVLDSLTLKKDGVDGKKIYLYGEGWKFGSLNDILPKKAMHQENAFGLGIGTFNDRIRDSLRGGNFSHSTKSDQGFINGLYYDYNFLPENTDTPTDLNQQQQQLLNYTDNIKVGLAGNLIDFELKNFEGQEVKGNEIIYRNFAKTAYSHSPQETINYVDAHDNYILWDQITAKSPFNVKNRIPKTATNKEKAKMQMLALDTIMFSQGIPFFHAGSEILRSKSGDGDSYDSGDWFNGIDFSYENNNWGIGLPAEWRNKNEWDFWKPRLKEIEKPEKKLIIESLAHFQRSLKIRKSLEVFRLDNLDEINHKLSFIKDDEKGEIPGVIVMKLKNDNPDVDKFKSVLVFFNALNSTVNFRNNLFKDKNFIIHPILFETIEVGNQKVLPEEYLKSVSFNSDKGEFSIPPKSTIVFIKK